MKNLILYCFLIGTFSAYGQSNFKINLLGSIDYSFSNYTYNNGMLAEEVNYEMPLGNSINFEIEYEVTSSLSVLTGLRYSKKIMLPRLLMPWVYGAILPKDGVDIYVGQPYLHKHELDLISLPISFKKYFIQKEKFGLYALIGTAVSFKYKEKETYRTFSEWDINRLEEDGIENNFAYSDKGISLYNSSIELGVGMNYKLTEHLNLLIQANAAVLEYRKENEKFKKNGDLLWEESFIPIGQAALGLGIQRLF